MRIFGSFGHITQVAAQAVAESRTTAEPILMKFNDIHIVVYPSTSADEVVRAWELLEHPRGDAYYAVMRSPAEIAAARKAHKEPT